MSGWHTIDIMIRKAWLRQAPTGGRRPSGEPRPAACYTHKTFIIVQSRRPSRIVDRIVQMSISLSGTQPHTYPFNLLLGLDLVLNLGQLCVHAPDDCILVVAFGLERCMLQWPRYRPWLPHVNRVQD